MFQLLSENLDINDTYKKNDIWNDALYYACNEIYKHLEHENIFSENLHSICKEIISYIFLDRSELEIEIETRINVCALYGFLSELKKLDIEDFKNYYVRIIKY